MEVSSPMLTLSSFFVLQSQCDDDISDAEKVYQECQQNGPVSFSDCIPPSRMKVCTKIGEGTFGEVFSTINDSNQTVALKVCTQYGITHNCTMYSYNIGYNTNRLFVC